MSAGGRMMQPCQTFGFRMAFSLVSQRPVWISIGWVAQIVALGIAKRPWLSHQKACFEVEKLILRVLATGYNLSEDYFLPFHSKADNQLRLLHYPRCAVLTFGIDDVLIIVSHSIDASLLRDEQSSRIPSHTDFCSITVSASEQRERLFYIDFTQILMQDDIGGLEVEDPNHPGIFIVRFRVVSWPSR